MTHKPFVGQKTEGRKSDLLELIIELKRTCLKQLDIIANLRAEVATLNRRNIEAAAILNPEGKSND